MTGSERLVTPDEAATHVGVTTRTLRRWRDEGLPHYLRGSTVRFRLSEIDAWMRDNGKDEESEPTGAAA